MSGGKPKGARAPAPVGQPRAGESDRVTYRELRNTPGRVWERLATEGALTLVAEGEAKAIVIPVRDGDVRSAMEAYDRGRALMTLRRIQVSARAAGTDTMTVAGINQIVRAVRRARRAAEKHASALTR